MAPARGNEYNGGPKTTKRSSPRSLGQDRGDEDGVACRKREGEVGEDYTITCRKRREGDDDVEENPRARRHPVLRAHYIFQVLDTRGHLLTALGYGLRPSMVLLSEIVQTFILADFCY